MTRDDGSQFQTIRVEQSKNVVAPLDDDEELIEVGAVRRTASSTEDAAAKAMASLCDEDAPSRRHAQDSHESRLPQETDVRREQPARENYVDRFEQADYGVDDLQPMPLVQKIILFVAILAVVYVGYRIICYWVGI